MFSHFNPIDQIITTELFDVDPNNPAYRSSVNDQNTGKQEFKKGGMNIRVKRHFEGFEY